MMIPRYTTMQSMAGTGVEIMDDFQRLDPELAQELMGMRGTILVASEISGIPGLKKALSSGPLKEKLQDVLMGGGVKFLQKQGEQRIIDSANDKYIKNEIQR